MAAKQFRGSKSNPLSTEGKPYFFDISTYDEMQVCYSCHAGGGPAEGIVKRDGTVTPYNKLSFADAKNSYDRDFYTYSSNDVTYALISGKSIEQTIKDIGAPKPVDWHKSGVMENDCLLCHIDPDYKSNPYVYRAYDGLYVQPFRPRLMIFAKRDANGKVTEISLGMALTDGVLNESALSYTDDIMRMTRPIGRQFYLLAQLPPKVIGDLFKIWTDGLKDIAKKKGVNSLPYALYAPPEINSYIYGPKGLKDEFTYNPKGANDEMQKLMANKNEIGQIFMNILNYAKKMGAVNLTMNDLYKAFFNKFIYGYEIRDPQTGGLLPLPFPLRLYKKGEFYTDWDSPDASVRDYVRSPLIEGEGINYSGMVGVGVAAFGYAYQLMKNGDMRYYDPNGFFNINLSKVIADWTEGKIDYNILKQYSTKHDYIQPFFNLMPSAELMGLDFNHDGYPITYIQIIRNGSSWDAKVYYNAQDLGDGNLDFPIFGGHKNLNSWKWVKICGQCHVMTKDDGNSEWTRGRTYNLGMPADWVKNGQYVHFTNDKEAPGYDVHMSGKKMGCGTCHFRESFNTLEEAHNFLKGTDTAHMVRNDLDNNPKPKTCEYCHLMGGDPDAPNPTKAHEEKFGDLAEKHLAKISCQACHIPYKRTWRFRAFDDSLGYYANFDNRFGYYILTGQLGNFPAMAFPSYYALSPVYGTSPGYGIPHFQMVSQHIDANGKGIQPMDYLAQMVDYFNFNSSSNPGTIVNGLMTNPMFDFWKLFYQISLERFKKLTGLPINYKENNDNEVFPPLYYANGANGYPQIVIGNPITILTWVDANPGPDMDNSKYFKGLPYNGAKVLYLREINAAIDKFLPVSVYYKYTPKDLENIPPQGCKDDPDIGKVVLKPTPLYPDGYVVCDHTGDGFPDLWWPEDVKAMQSALVQVLKAEGEANPKPMLFMAAHYFSDSHGVQPAEKALGAKSCNDCHGDYRKDPGAHRITDRVIAFLPWAPAWFKEEYRALKFDEKSGKMVPNENVKEPLFIVDGEVYYIKPVNVNGVKFLGAEERDILKLSYEHAKELFTMAQEGVVLKGQIANELGVSKNDFTEEELNEAYVRQVVDGPWSDKLYFYIPEELKMKIVSLGFTPGKSTVYVKGKGFVRGYILNAEVENEGKSFIIKLPFTGANPKIYIKKEGEKYFEEAKDVKILNYEGAYLTVKVKESGEYLASEGYCSSKVMNELLAPWRK